MAGNRRGRVWKWIMFPESIRTNRSTLVPVVAHWWIGTRVGSYIDARDELQLTGKE